MYFCSMNSKTTFIHLTFSINYTDVPRYLVLAEISDQTVKGIYLVPIPSWVVFYSETYKFYCINFN